MAMAQRLEVYRRARDGAKAGGEKKGSRRFQKKNKKGTVLIVQENEAEEVVSSHLEPAKEARQRQGATAKEEKAVQQKMLQLWRRSPPKGV